MTTNAEPRDGQAPGGTPDETPKDGQGQQNTVGKTYTEDQMKELVAAAAKAGATDVWNKFQSQADRQVAQVKKDAETETERLRRERDDFEQRLLTGMSSEERQEYLLKRVLERQNAPAVTPSQTPSQAPTDSSDQAAVAKEQIASALREVGIDPDKVDWNDLPNFAKSVVAQAKGGAATPPADQSGQTGDKDDSTGDDDEGDKAPPVDMSRSAGNETDITKMRPEDIIKSQKWTPIRGMDQ